MGTNITARTQLRFLIGERERANLVVQLARFFVIYICLYVFPDFTQARQFHAHRVSRMRKYIPLRSSTGHLYYSWQGRVLLVVGLRYHGFYSCSLYYFALACINNLYCNHQVLASAFCQLLYHFLPYISWIAPARQQRSTFCKFTSLATRVLPSWPMRCNVCCS